MQDDTTNGFDFMHLNTHDLCKLLLTVIEGPRFDTRMEKLHLCTRIADLNGWTVAITDVHDFAITYQNHMGSEQLRLSAYKGTILHMKQVQTLCDCCDHTRWEWKQKRGYGTQHKVSFTGTFS